MVDCEWVAADRYDDGSRTKSELARLVMLSCTVQRNNLRQALHIPTLNDPQTDLEEYQDAQVSVENARCARLKVSDRGQC